MGLVATAMAEEFCTYSVVKLDSEVLRLVKAASALEGKHTQDWLSDVANAAASARLNHKPIKRRPIKKAK